MMTGPPIGAHECPLGEGSVIRLFTGFLARDLEAGGTLEFECGTPDGDGVAECSCGVLTFDPVNVPGIGFACLTPAMTPCTTGKVACDGGAFVGVDIRGDHSRDFTCTDNANCETMCTQKCGSSQQVVASGCEGFCTEGTEESCQTDMDCLPDNGACNGKDGVPLGNVCECTCVDDLGPASRPGGLQCQLAFNLVVEAATANPPNCDGDGDRPLINAGDACAPLSTENSMAILTSAEGVPGATVPSTGPYEDRGTPISCDALRQGTSGLQTRGAAVFYGSTIGDLVTGVIVNCE